MLFLVLQANYGEKISLMQIFSLVNTNAPGLVHLSKQGHVVGKVRVGECFPLLADGRANYTLINRALHEPVHRDQKNIWSNTTTLSHSHPT